jgi:DNA uptake protein ComE-like DNA-binding protein
MMKRTGEINMKTVSVAMALAIVLAMGSTVAVVEAQVGKNMGILNPNLAGEKELLTLPHLDAKLVKAIIDKRAFTGMAALHEFLSASLKKEQLAELYAKLFLPLNLNTATEEEIMLIPGVGKRLAHEFEEYRPYRALAQFRREIGKYVDDKEVARLEQYVFAPINLNTASDEDILSIPGVGSRMLHEFKEYRPYKSLEQFRREIGKYVNEKELARLERYVTLE